MMGPYRFDIIEKIVEIHRDELMREAQRARISREAALPRHTIWEKPVWNLGGALIAFGSWLQSQSRTIIADNPCNNRDMART